MDLKSPLNKAFDALKNVMIGEPVKDINTIDNTIDKISNLIINKDTQNYAELIRRSFADSINKDVFKSLTPNTFFSYDTLDRLMRYLNAEQICDSIPYCARALKIMSDEIVSPDEITRTVLQFLESGNIGSEFNKRCLANLRSINSILGIEDMLHNITYETLKQGDQFIEICDYMAEDIPLTQSLLNEEANSVGVISELGLHEVEYPIHYEDENGNNKTDQYKVSIQPILIESVAKTSESLDINRVRLIIHDSRYVIKLQTNRFKMCLGYLVLPRPNDNMGAPNALDPGSCGSYKSPQTFSSIFHGFNYMRDFTGIDKVYTDIIGAVKKHIGTSDISLDRKEVMNMLAKVIKDFEDQISYTKFEVRYVPPHRMEHFFINRRRFFPYGEGIFHKISFSAKLLIAFETALTIKRISDSSDKRVISVETGIPRNVRSLIEEIKTSMQKKRFSMDTMGNIGSIPCLDLNTNIRLTNGNTLTLNDIIYQFNKGEELEVYCYNHETGTICPDKIVKARVTGRNVEVIKVTLDNNESIVCTPDHLFMMRDGSYIEAKKLKENDSLMPSNHKVKCIEIMNDRIDVGDIETEHFHNFMLYVGVFVHNSMITSYENYFVPQNKGKKYVEFDTLPPTINIRDISDELKLMRDMLVANLEIPPSFLALEENLCLHMKTLFTMVDGRKITLEQVIEDFNNGIYNEIYSYDPIKGVVFPNKIIWAGKTRLNTQCVRVWLDNDQYVDCTPDHLFMLRNGSYIEAKDLKENDSLMPFYHKIHYSGTSRGKYKELYHPGINEWQLEHQSFALYCNITDSISSESHTHHINTNPIDNRSCNLIKLTPSEHVCIHARIKNYSIHELENLVTNDREKLINLSEPGVRITYIKENCVICSKEFTRPHNINQTTCSDECRSKRKAIDGHKSWKVREVNLREQYPILTKNCDWCGTEFEMVKQSGYNENKYYACENKHCKQSIKNLNISLGKVHGRTHSTIEYTNCEICGNLMSWSPDNRMRVLKSCCNNEICRNTVISRRGAEIRKLECRVDLECPYCGIKFWRHKKYASQFDHLCCGKKECFSQLRLDYFKNKKEEKESKVVGLNHKVLRVELLEGLYDTGDITVEKYSNFAVDAGVFIHNSNRTALSYENIIFARTIMSYQNMLAVHIKNLFSKIYKLVYEEVVPPTIKVTFPPPKRLQIENEADYAETVQRLISALTDLGIDKEYLKRKYLSFDWKEIAEFETGEKIEAGITKPNPDENQT